LGANPHFRPNTASQDKAIGPVPAWLEAHARSAGGANDPVAYLSLHSRSFRFATRFLPPREGRRIAEIYAFCRFTDDLVDKSPDLAPAEIASRLDEWESLARQAHAGATTGLRFLDLPLGRMGREGISFSHAAELIEGMRMDISPRPFATMAELETYTYRVAGVVGQWLTEMAGVRNPWVLACAADLGHAMQLTNILRDVGEDWNRGRLYLPLDALAGHGLSPSDFEDACRWNGRPPRAYRDLMEDMIGMAESRYRRALQGIPALPDYFQRPVLVAALVYRRIHAALRENGYDNFGKRAHSGWRDKLLIGVKALWLLPSIRDLFPQDTPMRHRAGLPQPSMAGLVRTGSLPILFAAALASAGPPGIPRAPQSGPPLLASSGPEDPAPDRSEVFALGLKELESADADMRLDPDALAPRLNRLRVLFVLGVKEKAYLDRADAEIALLRAGRDRDTALSDLLLAYQGAVRVVRAKHGFNPNRKLEHLKAGIPWLDSAVARSPRQSEIRYLRLVSGFYLPFFIGRKPEVQEDFAALAELLPGAAGEYPPKWFLSVAGFVLEKGNLDRKRRTLLAERMKQVAADSGLASRDGSGDGE
jgi:phytoene synthase